MDVPVVKPDGHAHAFPAAGFWLQQLVAGHTFTPFADVPPVAKTPPKVAAAALASPPPLELALLPELVLPPLLLELALLPLLLPELALPPLLLELALLPLPPELALPPLVEAELPAPLE
jgi:hypothetical protein